jgi:hypothetical protein
MYISLYTFWNAHEHLFLLMLIKKNYLLIDNQSIFEMIDPQNNTY